MVNGEVRKCGTWPISRCQLHQLSANILLESGKQYIGVSRFSSVSSGCLTRGVINAARIVLFKFYA